MRKWITLVEGIHPAEIETSELVAWAKRIHHNDYDWDDGDIYDRIWQFYRYELKSVPISSLPQDEWDCDEDQAEEYSQLPADTSPPIIYDPINDSIIDGTHRLHAAKMRGDRHILAYVGVKSTYEKIDRDD